MAITPNTQILAGITFAKDTAANRAVANSATGGAASDLSDIINPITLATGKITCTSGNTTITGIGTAFYTDFVVGDYLFSYSLLTAAPSLLGKISQINSDTSMEIADDAPTTINAPGLYCGKTNVILAAKENIIMRVPVTRGSGTTFYLPNWNAWRTTPGVTQFNNSTYNSLKQFSYTNNPTQEDPSQPNVSYTITALYGWVGTPTGGGKNQLQSTLVYFPNEAAIPTFAYALLNPFGAGNDVLASNTLYKLFADQQFNSNCFVGGINTVTSDDLKQAGYWV